MLRLGRGRLRLRPSSHIRSLVKESFIPRHPSTYRWVALIAIALAAVNLRTAVASLSPLLSFLSEEISVSVEAWALLGALPPLGFALGAFLTPLLTARIGFERLMLVVLGALTLSLGGRALAGGSLALLLTSAVAFSAIGVLNVLLPPIVKRYFARSIGVVTTLYVTLMSVGTFVAPLAAVPLAIAWGWRLSLLTWAILALVAAISWLPFWKSADQASDSGQPMRAVPVRGLPFTHMIRSPITWGITALCGAPGFIAYAIFAWYPTMTIETAGATVLQAGTLLAFYSAMGAPGALILPLLVKRDGAIIGLIIACGCCFVVGFTGMLIAPAAGVWLWAMLGGLGQLHFPLSLTLMGMRARTERGSASLSSVTQGSAYLIASAGPVLIGILHDRTAAWAGSLVLLVVVAAVGTALGLLAGKRRYIEDGLSSKS